MLRAANVPFDLKASLISALATNNRINCYLIEGIPEEAWTAKPPEGTGRTICAIVAHIHNVRLMWLKAIGVASLPIKLADDASREEAIRLLLESHNALSALLPDALENGQVKSFKPDAASFFAYLISHDSHHRGQIVSLARRLGYPVSKSIGFGMWEWGSRSKEA